jgi:hypothetical protein
LLKFKALLVTVILLGLGGSAFSTMRRGGTLPKRPAVRVFKSAATRPAVSAMTTSFSGTRATVSARIDLGMPRLEKVTESVEGAPQGLSFSRLTWPKTIAATLPPGATLVDAQKSDRESTPGISLTFAVPASATNFSIETSDAQWKDIDAHFLPGSFTHQDTIRYRYTGKYLGQLATQTIARPRTFRSLRSVTVWLPLVRSRGSVRSVMTSFNAQFRFSYNRSLNAAPIPDPIFGDINRALILNSQDLIRFAIPLRPQAVSRGKNGTMSVGAYYAPLDTSSYRWIDPSATYIKLTVTRDGIYRVASEQIFDRAGHFDLAASGWNAHNIRLFHHGHEVPIVVDSEADGKIAAIWFYGERLRGQGSEFYNVSTDSSGYFLTNAGTGPVRRYRTRAVDPSLAHDAPGGEVLLHHERDLFYYLGDDEVDQTATSQRTEVVPGERFYWYGFRGPEIDPSHSNQKLTDTFYVSGLPANTDGKTAKIHVFLRGISVDPDYPNDPTHHAIVQLNGQQIDESFFKEYDSVAIESTVPLSQLHAGANELTVISAGTRARNDLFYLDYYEVRYESAIAPSADTAIARGQYDLTLVGPGVQLLASLPQDAVAFDLTSSTLIRAPFVDSVADSTRFAIATPASALSVNSYAKITDWSILDRRNEADYLLITHPDFRNAAERLKIRRASAGLKSMVVSVTDVYNAFGYGSDGPEALRRYLSYAYYAYSGTPVAMVTLVGDGSTDPKLNLNNEYWPASDRSNQRSFIPTYGDPVSDFYYTLSDVGTLDTLQPKMLISRIPVSKLEEADAYITKLIEYETQAPAEWNHDFLFVAGGNEGVQHREFVDEARYYLAPDGVGLSLPPSNVHSQIIERTDFGSEVDLGHVPEIQSAVREGKSIFYFAGHGATFITDVRLGDPNLWRNKSLYPVFITLSCRTGAFAEPNQISLNESFLRADEGGVIMAFGTTGFGEVTYDNFLSSKLFQLMRTYPQWHDTTRATTMNLTQLFTMSKLYASDTLGGYGFVDLNARLQYAILGDAALGFALRPQPEFVERSSDIHVVNRSDDPTTTVRISDTTMRVTAVVHNVGFSAQRPVIIRIRDAGPKGLPFDVFDTLPRLDTTETVQASFLLSRQSVGEHTISVKIDPLDQYAETHEEDNEASTKVLVSGISVTPFYPYEGASGVCDISGRIAHAILIVPRSEQGVVAGKIEVELDTTSAFSRPWHTEVATGDAQYVELDLDLANVGAPSTGVYWWRSRLVPSAGDPSDWQSSSFAAEPARATGFAYISGDQLRQSIVSGLDVNANGRLYLPEHDTDIFDVVSLSSTDPFTFGVPRSSISINHRTAYEFVNIGFALAELTSDGSSIDTVFEFLHSDDSAQQVGLANEFDSLVSTIPIGRKVIVFSNWQPFMYYFSLSPKVQSALESLGATQGFKTVGYFESYAMIGVKGMTAGQAKEARSASGSGPTELLDTVLTLGTKGVAEPPPTAVALRYHSLSWEGPALPGGTDIQFAVRGLLRGTGKSQSLLTFNASAGSSFDISSIDPAKYDRVSVVASLLRTSSSDQSPQLSGIRVTYDPAPELVFAQDSIVARPNPVPEGVPVVAGFSVRTLTCTAADQFPLQLLINNKGHVDTVHSVIVHLDGHTTLAFADTLQTIGQQGVTQLLAVLNPDGSSNEQLLFNDQVTGSYVVGRDTTKPVSDILIDDRHLPAYGYASSDPWVTINLITKSAIRQTDSLSITARFLREDSASNFVLISPANPGDFRVVFEPSPAGSTQASLRFQPLHPLAPGRYQVAAYSHDASGNVADTLVQTFTVSPDNGIEHVMNYPNPFKGETDFTYVLRNDARTDLKIVVYTIAGRKLRTLRPVAVHAGMNQLHWDGRDEDGNLLANGTYLYRVVMTSTDADGRSQTQGITEKAVLAR